MEGLDTVRAMWKARKLPGKNHSATPDYVPDLTNIDLEGYENIAMLAGKGNEVKQWISLHAPEGCSYVIIDDMPDFLPEQEVHLLCTNPVMGLTRDIVNKAIAILRNQS